MQVQNKGIHYKVLAIALAIRYTKCMYVCMDACIYIILNKCNIKLIVLAITQHLHT